MSIYFATHILSPIMPVYVSPSYGASPNDSDIYEYERGPELSSFDCAVGLFLAVCVVVCVFVVCCGGGPVVVVLLAVAVIGGL